MKMDKVAFLTGITGQDGSYLAELLLSKGYEVHGIVRRESTINTSRICHLEVEYTGENKPHIITHYGDLSDTNSIIRAVSKVKPTEIYNLGSMSHVKVSFENPVYTGDITGLGVCRLLEAIKHLIDTGNLHKKTKFYQASSSEQFGLSPPPQNEKTTMLPVSPYGIAKLYAYHLTRAYRFGYNMFSTNGILFNHESPKRGETFVTKKIIRSAVRIKEGKQEELVLGNLSAKRDWGYAGDYVEAMYKIMHYEKPEDFVIATEYYHSVEEFARLVFKKLNLDFDTLVRIDESYFRPNEVPQLKGDASKAKELLKWKPKVNFEELIDMMIKSVEKEEKQGYITTG